MNVEHRYSTIYNKDKATRPPRLSEPTKGRRALSTARDGGQERLPGRGIVWILEFRSLEICAYFRLS